MPFSVVVVVVVVEAFSIKTVELCVKLENRLESAFKTNIGSPKGDGASALFLH